MMKELIHAPKKCGGVFSVEYTDEGTPYLQCDKCDHKMNDWIKWEEKYSMLWANDEKWNSKQDHMMCLLGYFLSVYKTHYNVKFVLSLSERGLFRGPEVNILRRVYKNFGGDAREIKAFIDWIFLTKVKLKKRRITSLGIMATPAVIQEYRLYKQKQKIITRDTQIPARMMEWIEKFAPEVNECVTLRDFGDLRLLLKHYKTGHLVENIDVSKFMNKLRALNYVDAGLNLNNWRD